MENNMEKVSILEGMVREKKVTGFKVGK